MRTRITLATVVLASSALLVSAGAAPQRGDRVVARTPSALVLRYTFNNDADGVVKDASPPALNGTLVNADPTTAYAPSVRGWGRALKLVGSRHQYVAVPEEDALDVDRYTLAALIRYTGIENDKTLGRWEVLEKAGAYWMNIRTNGLVRVGGYFGACTGHTHWKFLDSTVAVPIKTWTHIASTYNAPPCQRSTSRSGSGSAKADTCSYG